MIIVNLNALDMALRQTFMTWIRHVAQRHGLQCTYALGANENDVLSFTDGTEVVKASAVRAEYDTMMQNMANLAEVATWA